MSTKLIAPAIILPVELALVKQHLRLDEEDSTEDVLLTQFIRAAEGICEQYQGRTYSKKTYRNFSDYILESVKLPFPPLVSITDVKLKLLDGTELIVPLADYFVDDSSFLGRVILKDPSKYQGLQMEPAGYQISFVAGYDTLPDNYVQALLLLTSHYYENREAMLVGTISKEMEFSVQALLSADRVVNV
jgi:uncharacterized phiE125 gp8 family phage protein